MSIPKVNDTPYISGNGPPFLPLESGQYKFVLRRFEWRQGHQSQGFWATVRILESNHAAVKVGTDASILFQTGLTDQTQQQYRMTDLKNFLGALYGEDPRTINADKKIQEIISLGESLEELGMMGHAIARERTIKKGPKTGQLTANFTYVHAAA